MSAHHHPDDSTILAYAAGALSEGFSLVIAAHAESCQRCQDRLSNAEAFGGELLMSLPPQHVGGGGLDDVWRRIEVPEESQAPRQPAPEVCEGVPAVLGSSGITPSRSPAWRRIPCSGTITS